MEEVKNAFLTAKLIQESVNSITKPRQEISPPRDEPILPHALFRGTRGYIEKVVYQINASYLATSYDGCAVMIRRLVETLVIEVFESKGLQSVITNQNGEYMYLSDLIAKFIAEPSWQVGRNAKKALTKLKDVGDLSAHNRRYNAQRSDIDNISTDLRVASEELLYLAGLRR